MQSIFQSSEGWELLVTLAGSSNTDAHILRSYQNRQTLQKDSIYAFKTIAISPPATTKLLSTRTVNHKCQELTQIKSQVKAHQRLKKYQCIAELYELLVEDDNNQLVKEFYRNFLKKQDKKGRYVSSIIEYCQRGNLKNYMNQRREITQKQVLQFSVQILSCLLSLQKQNIIHRDISTNNLLIGQRGIKLTDFDTAFLKNYSTLADLIVPIRQNSSAPQILKLYNLAQAQKQLLSAAQMYEWQSKCDIYSFGTVLFNLLTGTQFKRQIIYKLNECEKSEQLKALVFQMLEDRQKRPQIQEIAQAIKRLALKNNVCFKESLKRELNYVSFALPEIVFHPSSCSKSKSNSLSLSDWSLEEASIAGNKALEHPKTKMPLSSPATRSQKPHHLTFNQ